MTTDLERRRRRRLLIPVAFGVVLIAVPTAFTVFPGWTRWPQGMRAAVLCSWLLLAFGGIWLTSKADDDLQRAALQDKRAAVRAERRAVISDQFRSILLPGIGGLPDQYHLTVYGPSPDDKFLIPLFPPALNEGDPAIFPSGAGATGKAWESPDGVFVVVGEAVSSPTHGLTAVQQRRYSMYGTVAATVIRADDDTPIGVLTAIARQEDAFFDDEDGVEVLRSLADGIAWLIPEAVRWMLPSVSNEVIS